MMIGDEEATPAADSAGPGERVSLRDVPEDVLHWLGRVTKALCPPPGLDDATQLANEAARLELAQQIGGYAVRIRVIHEIARRKSERENPRG